MDFMDDDMKEIAMEAFHRDLGGTTDGVYAACEAVLAEEKRQKQAWDGYPPLEEAPPQMDATTLRHPAQQASLGELTPDELSRFRQRLNIPAELVRQPAPKPQMTAAERDAFTRAQQEFDNGETVPAPADDVVERMKVAYRKAAGCYPDELGVTAALAVAREGMVPATLIGELKDACDRDWTTETAPQVITITANAMRWRNDKIKDLEQQLAAMYSLEQVEKAVRQVWGEQGWASSTGMVVIEGVRARLTARQPTDRLWS